MDVVRSSGDDGFVLSGGRVHGSGVGPESLWLIQLCPSVLLYLSSGIFVGFRVLDGEGFDSSASTKRGDSRHGVPHTPRWCSIGHGLALWVRSGDGTSAHCSFDVLLGLCVPLCVMEVVGRSVSSERRAVPISTSENHPDDGRGCGESWTFIFPFRNMDSGSLDGSRELGALFTAEAYSWRLSLEIPFMVFLEGENVDRRSLAPTGAEPAAHAHFQSGSSDDRATDGSGGFG